MLEWAATSLWEVIAKFLQVFSIWLSLNTAILEIGHGGAICTTVIGKHDKSGLGLVWF